MTEHELTFVATIAQVVAAIAAVAGLVFVGVQIRSARKVADPQALQRFLEDASAFERRLLEASGDEARNTAFFELLNFLETSATALNAHLYPTTSARMIKEKLRDSLAVIDASPFRSKIESAITSNTTFIEIRKFIENNRTEIAALVEAHRKLD
jgi:hypothetical protein